MPEQKTIRLTMAQAVIAFLKQQYSERDGLEYPFFGGCFGIFGHGIVAGIGQALQQNPDFRYYQVRNEQAMVHASTAYAKVKNRLQTMVLHFFHWTRGNQYGHRRSHGNDQPSPGAVVTRRYFCPPECSPGIAAA